MEIAGISAALERSTGSAQIEARLSKLEDAERQEHDAEVARDIEGLFAQMFVKEMRRGLGEGFFGQGAGSDTFEGWLDEKLGDSLAQDGVLDLAGRVKTSLDTERRLKAETAARLEESER